MGTSMEGQKLRLYATERGALARIRVGAVEQLPNSLDDDIRRFWR
jgi:hypothetical protein